MWRGMKGFSRGRIMPLALLPDGSKGTVRMVIGGFGMRRRLRELGFTEGEEIRVLKGGGPGPVVVLIRGSRVALGRGVAMKVFVEVVEL